MDTNHGGSNLDADHPQQGVNVPRLTTLIVIAAPYLPLIDQWCEEVQAFGITPVNLTNASGASARRKLIAKSRRRLRHRRSDVEVLVATHDTLCDPDFIDAASQDDVPKLLIADEVHNLGRQSFVAGPPTCFKHRLGLSATPVRQYDPEGTALLTDYFGEIVFSFPLEQAIGVCLVPYDYYVHTGLSHCGRDRPLAGADRKDQAHDLMAGR